MSIHIPILDQISGSGQDQDIVLFDTILQRCQGQEKGLFLWLPGRKDVPFRSGGKGGSVCCCFLVLGLASILHANHLLFVPFCYLVLLLLLFLISLLLLVNCSYHNTSSLPFVLPSRERLELSARTVSLGPPNWGIPKPQPSRKLQFGRIQKDSLNNLICNFP